MGGFFSKRMWVSKNGWLMRFIYSFIGSPMALHRAPLSVLSSPQSSKMPKAVTGAEGSHRAPESTQSLAKPTTEHPTKSILAWSPPSGRTSGACFFAEFYAFLHHKKYHTISLNFLGLVFWNFFSFCSYIGHDFRTSSQGTTRDSAGACRMLRAILRLPKARSA